MDFRILGPLEVWDGARPLELRRPKQRVLLAGLLLRAGQVVSVDQLLDDLWGERPPPTARGSLQNMVSALRKVLGDAMRTEPPGYLLDVEPEQVDLFRFERLLAEARGSASEEGRAETLRQALALWRGPLLADLAFERLVLLESPRLEELRLAAQEERFEARLALGERAELVPELEALVAEHPFDERLCGQLMLALYGAGRQSEALEHYREARRLLVAELGLEPGAPLRELEHAILRQDPGLTSSATTRRPAFLPMRKTATVLFAELLGSSAVAEQLDPEVLSQLLDRAFATTCEVVERHAGTIEPLPGGAVLAVFGVPRAHEDDAVCALRAALTLRDELALDNELKPRIGVDTGELFVSDSASAGPFAGAVVSNGKRLAEGASAGEVLLGAATARLVGESARTEALEPLRVSEEHRLGAWRLRGLREDAPAIPRRLEAPFVGRAQELAKLRNAFESARSQSRCRLALLVGEPGIGKTRLARELIAEVRRRGRVLVGGCASYGRGATWLPLAEIVRGAGAETPEALRALLATERDGELVARLLAGVIGSSEEAGSIEETKWAARRMFEALARQGPLLLVFEDLHWAESALLDLVEYVGERASGPILLLCLTRPELIETRLEWVEPAITLAALPETDVGVLVDSLPSNLDSETRARVVEVAEGNPLFAEQLVAHAQEKGSESLEVAPPSIEAVLASRIDLLSVEERALLQRAAVIGRRFSRAGVLGLSAGAPTSTEAQLQSLGDKGFIGIGTSDESLSFHHVLLRSVAYAGIPKSERAELHERFAAWLDAGDRRLVQPDEVVGYHLEQSARYKQELGQPDHALARRASERLATGGRDALHRGDDAAAASLLERALDLTRLVQLDVRLELDLAWAYQSSAPDYAMSIADAAAKRAAETGDKPTEALAGVASAMFQLETGDDPNVARLEELAQKALPLLQQANDHAGLVRVFWALGFGVAGYRGQYEAAAEAAEQALKHARLAGPEPHNLFELDLALVLGPRPADEALRVLDAALPEAPHPVSVLLFRALLVGMLGRFDEAWALAHEADARARELSGKDEWHLFFLGSLAALAGDHEAAAGYLRANCDWLEAAGHRGHLSSSAPTLGRSLCALGRFDEAGPLGDLGRELGDEQDVTTQILWRQVKALVHANRLEYAEAERLAREAVAIGEQTDALNLQGDALCDLACVLQEGGRLEDATDALEQALERYARKRNLAMVELVRAKLAEPSGAAKQT